MTYPPVRLRGYPLRQELAYFGHTRATVAFQTDTYSDVSGLSVLLEPHARYAIDGYIAYQSGETADVKFALAAPEGATGHWGMYPQTTTATGSIGDLVALRLDDFSDSEQEAAAGSNSFSSAMMCIPHGYVDTNRRGGALQVRFAQNTTTAATTLIAAGSWLRAVLIARKAI